MDGMPTTKEQLSVYAMDGLYADNAGRLHGCRRYASMDGCARTASGTAVESNAGAVAEQLSAMSMDGLRQRTALTHSSDHVAWMASAHSADPGQQLSNIGNRPRSNVDSICECGFDP
jgi:hypothetical protein